VCGPAEPGGRGAVADHCFGAKHFGEGRETPGKAAVRWRHPVITECADPAFLDRRELAWDLGVTHDSSALLWRDNWRNLPCADGVSADTLSLCRSLRMFAFISDRRRR
jgi:hypothetical protein